VTAELDFVHLHLAKADRQPALALTDTDNLFGALGFSEKMAGAGIQAITGRAPEVRFPRPEDADRARRRGEADRPARHRARPAEIPLDDESTYPMLARGETCGVFQVESQGMRRALIDMVPDRFEDLIVLVALYRASEPLPIPSSRARRCCCSSLPSCKARRCAPASTIIFAPELKAEAAQVIQRLRTRVAELEARVKKLEERQ
jgi:DNA polymerase III alpha subunit